MCDRNIADELRPILDDLAYWAFCADNPNDHSRPLPSYGEVSSLVSQAFNLIDYPTPMQRGLTT